MCPIGHGKMMGINEMNPFIKGTILIVYFFLIMFCVHLVRSGIEVIISGYSFTEPIYFTNLLSWEVCISIYCALLIRFMVLEAQSTSIMGYRILKAFIGGVILFFANLFHGSWVAQLSVSLLYLFYVWLIWR